MKTHYHVGFLILYNVLTFFFADFHLQTENLFQFSFLLAKLCWFFLYFISHFYLFRLQMCTRGLPWCTFEKVLFPFALVMVNARINSG